MKALASLVLVLLFGFTQAAPVTLQFEDVKLSQLVKIVMSDMMQKSYVLDAALPDVTVSLSLPDVQPKTVQRELGIVLRRFGFAFDCSDQVCRVVPSISDPREVVVYRPRFRSVAYLKPLVQPWFPQDSFGGTAPNRITQDRDGHAMQTMPTINSQTGQLAATTSNLDVLTFRGSADDIKRFRGLVAQLDDPEPQVVVQAMVYEVQTSIKEGSAWDLAASILKARLGLSFKAGELAGSGLTLSIGDFSAAFSALSSDSRFTVVATPKVRVVSGGNAKFTVGDEVPVLGGVTTTGNTATQSVQYRSSGVILDIGADVFRDVAKLSVTQQISQFSTTQTGIASSPTLTKRELKTDLVVKPGDTVVLGGLNQTKDSGAGTSLSFAKWLKSETAEAARTEILVFLSVQSVGTPNGSP